MPLLNKWSKFKPPTFFFLNCQSVLHEGNRLNVICNNFTEICYLSTITINTKYKIKICHLTVSWESWAEEIVREAFCRDCRRSGSDACRGAQVSWLSSRWSINPWVIWSLSAPAWSHGVEKWLYRKQEDSHLDRQKSEELQEAVLA